MRALENGAIAVWLMPSRQKLSPVTSVCGLLPASLFVNRREGPSHKTSWDIISPRCRPPAPSSCAARCVWL